LEEAQLEDRSFLPAKLLQFQQHGNRKKEQRRGSWEPKTSVGGLFTFIEVRIAQISLLNVEKQRKE
jgi:hypothetical protein